MSFQFTSNADRVYPVLMPSNPYALALNPLVRAIDKRHAELWCLLKDETERRLKGFWHKISGYGMAYGMTTVKTAPLFCATMLLLYLFREHVGFDCPQEGHFFYGSLYILGPQFCSYQFGSYFLSHSGNL